MLRISPPLPQKGAAPEAPPVGGPPGMPPPAMPPDPMGAPPLPDAVSAGKYDAEKVSQPLAMYRDPKMGPFACGNCRHFDSQGGCDIVQGAIDPAGLCNLFESGGAAPQDDQDGDELPQGPPLNG